MNWYIDMIKKIQQLSVPKFIIFVTAKVLGGIGIGILLAGWLPWWTWWIFIIAGFLIAIPVFTKIFSR